jgi:dTDP-glucose 4,6-dehydratase
MRIIVTGGCGFIGSAVIRHYLADTPHEILNIDKLTYAACPDNLKDFAEHPRYRFNRVDIANRQVVAEIFRAFKPDAVMHLAAESHVDRSIDGPGDFIQTNIVGTFSLLEVARAYYAELSAEEKASFRFHHVSTDEVFGSLGETGYFTETTPYAPNSPYSASKASSDMLARAWHETYGLPVLISNCSNNYGPYQFPEKLIPVVILSVLEGKPIPVYGRGVNIRDWLYVEDHARALALVLERARPGETYNVGGNSELTNLEVVRRICDLMDEITGRSGAPSFGLVTHVQDRPGHDRRYAIDASKIARDLGWTPRMNVDQGLRATVNWYLQNSWWWQAIRDRGFDGGRLGLMKTQRQA